MNRVRNRCRASWWDFRSRAPLPLAAASRTTQALTRTRACRRSPLARSRKTPASSIIPPMSRCDAATGSRTFQSRQNFGIAEQHFRDAVEKAPKDASAWIGLAASYDRLGRFDLADRAYQSAIHLVGETTAILNNRGGNLVAARQDFLKALEREPGNPTILNNLKLLDGSQRFIARSPDAP